MRALSTASSVVRHVLEVGAQAFLIAAIVAALLLALSPLYRPADVLVGSGRAEAGGRAHSHDLNGICESRRVHIRGGYVRCHQVDR